MPNRTPPGRKAECIPACHLAELAINDEEEEEITSFQPHQAD
jgi:hypothetical protein